MSTKKQSAKILGLLSMFAMAFGVVAAPSFAATWTVEGSKLSEGTANGLATSTTLKEGTTATLKSKLLGQEFVLTSTTISSSSGLIFQEGTKAKSSGVLELSGLTIDKPAGCSVESPIKTKPLTGELLDVAGSENKFQKLFPEEGEVLATIKVSGCAVAGTYSLKGALVAEDGAWLVAALVILIFVWNTHMSHTAGIAAPTLASTAAEFSAETETKLASGKKFNADT